VQLNSEKHGGVKDTSLKAKAEDSTLKAKAKTKDFKIVLEDPGG